ncbi:hypothetical protein MetexDRAFT_0221 [Methylorubrum extorquens DSM 13060]|uniref:Uncharacterized protein n=1 Tax=Methylorubrum extorquens DSM 13060 TaxID=882800 RepID=H1KC59_METEX|nr:hypothetical protein MetexDRAFT_0221 [Methylorubrum extorquens DSM 13060]
MSRSHPSGRPIRQPNRREWPMVSAFAVGFRCPRLNPQHIEQATDTHAVGFIDWRVREAQDELEGRKR